MLPFFFALNVCVFFVTCCLAWCKNILLLCELITVFFVLFIFNYFDKQC